MNTPPVNRHSTSFFGNFLRFSGTFSTIISTFFIMFREEKLRANHHVCFGCSFDVFGRAFWRNFWLTVPVRMVVWVCFVVYLGEPLWRIWGSLFEFRVTRVDSGVEVQERYFIWGFAFCRVTDDFAWSKALGWAWSLKTVDFGKLGRCFICST